MSGWARRAGLPLNLWVFADVELLHLLTMNRATLNRITYKEQTFPKRRTILTRLDAKFFQGVALDSITSTGMKMH